VKALLAHTRIELSLALRKGETLLLTLGIPVLFLVFFSTVDVISVPTPTRVSFLFPGIVALSVLSSAFVSPSIATGFERGYGALARLQATPLGKGRLLAAKSISVTLVELLQIAVMSVVAIALGYELPEQTAGPQALSVVLLITLATICFGGLAFLCAGLLRMEVNLAASNGLYLVLLLVSGMIVPLSKLGGLEPVAKLLPSTALSEGLHACLSFGQPVSAVTWIVLVVWALATPLLAVRFFSFE
jgi:ABC-2 type transport system permease protein